MWLALFSFHNSSHSLWRMWGCVCIRDCAHTCEFHCVFVSFQKLRKNLNRSWISSLRTYTVLKWHRKHTRKHSSLFFCEDQSLKNTFLWPYHPFFHPSWKNGFLDQTSTVKSWGRNTYSAPVSLSLNYSLFFHIQWRFVKLLHCDWIWQQYQRELKKKNQINKGTQKNA